VYHPSLLLWRHLFFCGEPDIQLGADFIAEPGGWTVETDDDGEEHNCESPQNENDNQDENENQIMT
jgi:hypothetical protein